ncbi:MAG: bifunctional phosphopantothenoylcysteine decarboxylase/phosphopantothenate--cysteine ligase CoaBC [Candidatus Lernaella stagnicola]|nr:bifunctional phosphopantothenoylcysteine decarboxylase/phosphopantothenate--cysteine ligase CoaBC [Candidatus Lernaella stagnicola]
MLSGKNVVVGITGGIAAYKTAMLVRLLTKAGANVDVIMTKNAAHFVGPLTFQTLSGNPVHVDTFKLLDTSDISHTSLADRADLVIVAPVTANLIGKYANGIADDLLTTTLLATVAPVLLAPAMNPKMWNHPAVTENMKTLTARGVAHVGPEPGEVACKDYGYGRMSEPEDILEAALPLLVKPTLAGRKIVISAGPTREPIDPVRYISNRSSGKMGYALARAAHILGADVTLISGPTALPAPPGVHRINVESAEGMLTAVHAAFQQADALIMAAAVSDFRPADPVEEKLPKDQLHDSLKLARNADIVAGLAAEKGKRLVFGFAAETGDADAKAAAKMKRKGLDAIVANDVAAPGIGFDTDENEVQVIFADGRTVALPRRRKEDLAFAILEALFG